MEVVKGLGMTAGRARVVEATGREEEETEGEGEKAPATAADKF